MTLFANRLSAQATLGLATLSLLGLAAAQPARAGSTPGQNVAVFGTGLSDGNDTTAEQANIAALNAAGDTVTQLNSLSDLNSSYNAVWIGNEGSTTSFSSSDNSALTSFLSGGGNVLAENVDGSALGSSQFTAMGAGGEAVYVDAPGNPLNAGLTSSPGDSNGLSNWQSSYHTAYQLNGNATQYVTISERFSAASGILTYTGQDPTFHNVYGSGPTGFGSQKFQLVENALTATSGSSGFTGLTSTSAPVPEASTTASMGLMLMLGLGGLAFTARRRAAAK